MIRNQRGQSTAEYAIVISVVIAAVIGMQLYVKRGMQGKVKDGVDFFTNQGGKMDNGVNDMSTLDQYEPYYAEGNIHTQSDSTETEQMTTGGAVAKTTFTSTQKRTGNQVAGVDWNMNNDTTNWQDN